jgi:hypothetical protein
MRPCPRWQLRYHGSDLLLFPPLLSPLLPWVLVLVAQTLQSLLSMMYLLLYLPLVLVLVLVALGTLTPPVWRQGQFPWIPRCLAPRRRRLCLPCGPWPRKLWR